MRRGEVLRSQSRSSEKSQMQRRRLRARQHRSLSRVFGAPIDSPEYTLQRLTFVLRALMFRESGCRQKIAAVVHFSDWSSMQGSSQAFLLYTQDTRSVVFMALLTINQIVILDCTLNRSTAPQFSACATFRGQRQSIIKYKSLSVFYKTAICARSVEDDVERSDAKIPYAAIEASLPPLQHKSTVHQQALLILTWGLPHCMRSRSSWLACWSPIKSASMVLVSARYLDDIWAAFSTGPGTAPWRELIRSGVVSQSSDRLLSSR